MPLRRRIKGKNKNDGLPAAGDNTEDHNLPAEDEQTRDIGNNVNIDGDNKEDKASGPTTTKRPLNKEGTNCSTTNKRPRLDMEIVATSQPSQPSNHRPEQQNQALQSGSTNIIQRTILSPSQSSLSRRRRFNSWGQSKVSEVSSQFYPGAITFGGNSANNRNLSSIPAFSSHAINPGRHPLGSGDNSMQQIGTSDKLTPKSDPNQNSAASVTGPSSTAGNIKLLDHQESPTDEQKITSSAPPLCSGATTVNNSIQASHQLDPATSITSLAPREATEQLHSVCSIFTPKLALVTFERMAKAFRDDLLKDAAAITKSDRSFTLKPPLPLPLAMERPRRIFTFVPPIGLEEDWKMTMVDQPTTTDGWGSVIKKLTGGECVTCMIRNPEERQQCAACESAKPVAAATSSERAEQSKEKLSRGSLDLKSSSTEFFPSPVPSYNFGDSFKSKSNTWECNTCFLVNQSTATNCIICQTVNPKSKTSTHKLEKQKSSKWICFACLAENYLPRQKCFFCDTLKPRSSDGSDKE